MQFSKLGLLAAASALAFAATPAFAQDADADAGATLGEIVVTAQKREQNLQDVPISVTALGQDALVANRIQNVSDLSALAPNLSVQTSPGGTNLPVFTLRGVWASGTLPGSDKEVSLNVDGVYLGSALGSIFDVADIERIEVLKGPQGTLFGRNATGGAINIITRNPPGEFGVRQEFTAGNYDQFRSRTRVDFPAVGPLSASVTYLHSERRGDIKNLGAGRVWDYSAVGLGRQVSPKTLGDQNTDSVFAAVRFEPNENFSITYKFDWTENHSTPEGVAPRVVIPSGLGATGGAFLSGVLATQPNPGVLSPTVLERPDAVNNAFSTPGYAKAEGHSITAKLRINDSLSLKNILAYRKAYARGSYELTGLGGLVNTLSPAIGPLGSPFVVLGTISYGDTTQWSDELQLNYDSDFLTLTTGLLHFSTTQTQGGTNGAPNTTVMSVVPNAVIRQTGLAADHVEVTSQALYAQAELHLTPQIDVIGGYRITKDSKDGRTSTPGLAPTFSYDKKRPAYLLGVNYRPTKDVMVYGKYSTAYMSGGSSFGLPYQPETAESWEAGFKADFLGRRVRTNFAAFTVKYINLQSPTSGVVVGLPQVGAVLINSGSARAKGFEFEGTALPMDGLTLGLGVGYTDFKYLSVNPIFGNTSTYLPSNRPKWTTNLSAQYDTQELFGDAKMSFRIDGNYRSKMRGSPYVPATPAIAAASVQDGAWVVNGRAALKNLTVGPGSLEIAVWGRNLTNDKSFDFLTALPFVYATSFQRARTFGIDLIYEY